jgi:dUTPase
MAESIIKFLKTRNVLTPSRGYPTDAGIDFYVPKFTPSFIKDLKEKNKELFAPKEVPYQPGAMFTVTGTLTIAGGSENSTDRVTYDLKDTNATVFKFDEEKGKIYFLLPPHSRVNIPSGISSKMMKEGRALIAANKSGTATKLGLVFAAQVVDYSYTGEIHIGVINTSTKVVRIYEDDKLLQFVETPVYTSTMTSADFEGMTEEEYNRFWEGIPKDRLHGGFGSTDKK